jgi:hypothetical protein
MATTSEATREAQARRALKRDGLVVRKDRARTWNIDHHGGYMVIDQNNNYVVGGNRYDLTLEDLERWADDKGEAPDGQGR